MFICGAGPQPVRLDSFHYVSNIHMVLTQTINRVYCPDGAFTFINLGHRWDGRRHTSKTKRWRRQHIKNTNLSLNNSEECENGRAHLGVQNGTPGWLLAPLADMKVFLSGFITPDQSSSHILLIWDLGWAALPFKAPPSLSASIRVCFIYDSEQMWQVD